MNCDERLFLASLAGFISGIFIGFLFRNSDAEREQAMNYGYRSRFLKLLYAPIQSLRGLALFITTIALLFAGLWLPSYILGIDLMCGDHRYWHKGALVIGGLSGWLLRYLLWRLYLHRL